MTIPTVEQNKTVWLIFAMLFLVRNVALVVLLSSTAWQTSRFRLS